MCTAHVRFLGPKRTCAISNAASPMWMTALYQGNLKVFLKSFTYPARSTKDCVGLLHTDTRGVAAHRHNGDSAP
jgi:hypothetical protein